MAEWVSTTLGAIVEAGRGRIQTGPFGSQLHASDYVDAGVPCIMPTNLKNNRVDLTGISFISDEDAQRLSQHLVVEGDIVYSRRGDVTQKALIREGEAGYFCGTGCLLLRAGASIDPEFLTYHLSTPSNQSWIVNQAVGAHMPNLNTGILAKVPLRVPPMVEQKRVASILSRLDSKICLNNRINAELEALAKTVYDYWFVQFDFPDADGRPYRSSGGAMVWNEALKREVPEGWQVGLLGDALKLEYGKPLKEESRSGSGFPVMGSNGVVGLHDEFLIEGPGIVVGRKGTAGAVTFVYENFYPIDTTYYAKPRRDYGFNFLLQLLRSLPLARLNSDSAVPGLNRDSALRLPVVLPEFGISRAYEERTAPFSQKAKSIHRENRELTRLRDWLLPLLMNGQVRVA